MSIGEFRPSKPVCDTRQYPCLVTTFLQQSILGFFWSSLQQAGNAVSVLIAVDISSALLIFPNKELSMFDSLLQA